MHFAFRCDATKWGVFRHVFCRLEGPSDTFIAPFCCSAKCRGHVWRTHNPWQLLAQIYLARISAFATSRPTWRRPEVIRTMQETIQTIQQALDVLLEEGWTLFRGTIQGSEGAHTLSFINRHMPYQAWYTKALRIIRQLYPERADDFQAHYRELLALQRFTPSLPWYRKALHVMQRLTAGRSQDAKDHASEGHSRTRPVAPETGRQTCLGMTITPNGEMIPSLRLTFLAHFGQQLRILSAVRDGLAYVLADLHSTLYGDVANHVLAAVYRLVQQGHGRAAGTLAGVLLELHLAHVAAKYRVAMGAKAPDINMLNTALKRGGIYDGEIWHSIQRLGALRDDWVDAARRDPTVDELTTFLHEVQTVRQRVR